METIPVLIAINANAHREAEQEEPMTLLTSGTMTLDGASITICYEETLDESIAPQSVEIIIADHTISMVRGGEYETSMVFHKGRRFEGQYRTPFGSMSLAVFCTRLKCDIGREGGEIMLSYQLDLNGQFAAMHDMEFRVITQNE